MLPSDQASSASSTPRTEAEQEEPPSRASSQPPTQRFRAIRPRPTALPSRSRQTLVVIRPGSCGIPQCNLSPCTLPSHHHYARARSLARRFARSQENLALSTTSTQRSSPITSLSSTPAPETSLDVFFKFPFEYAHPPELRSLFHYFSTEFIDKYDAVYNVSPRFGSKKAMVERSLSEDIFTMVALAYAKCDLMGQVEDHSFDGATSFIQSKLAQIVREKLETFQPSDVGILVFCVVAMANLDYRKQDVLETHRLALQHLIEARGGVHNLLEISGLVLQADRRLAVMMESAPAFENLASKAGDNAPQVAPPRYGSAFSLDIIAQTLDADVLSFCIDAVTLITWFEDNEISYESDRISREQANKLPLFHYMRDRVSSHFAHAYAKHAKQPGKDRYFLTATKLVEYPLVYGDCLSHLTEHLATKLTVWLLRDLESYPSPEWQDSSDSLMWILWVLVTLKVTWPTKTWVRGQLKTRLKNTISRTPVPPSSSSAKKGSSTSSKSKKAKGNEKASDLPSTDTVQGGWREEQWNKNMPWVWCRALKERFDRYCDYADNDDD
jgi:hypothetical protein